MLMLLIYGILLLLSFINYKVYTKIQFSLFLPQTLNSKWYWYFLLSLFNLTQKKKFSFKKGKFNYIFGEILPKLSVFICGLTWYVCTSQLYPGYETRTAYKQTRRLHDLTCSAPWWTPCQDLWNHTLGTDTSD